MKLYLFPIHVHGPPHHQGVRGPKLRPAALKSARLLSACYIIAQLK